VCVCMRTLYVRAFFYFKCLRSDDKMDTEQNERTRVYLFLTVYDDLIFHKRTI